MKYLRLRTFPVLVMFVSFLFIAPIGSRAQTLAERPLDRDRGEAAAQAERARLFHEQAQKDVADFHASAAYPDYLNLRLAFAAAADRLQAAEEEQKGELVLGQLKQPLADIEGRLRDQVEKLPELTRMRERLRQVEELAARQQELSASLRRQEILMSGLKMFMERTEQLRKAHRDLEARIAEKEKELPSQEGEVRLRNATYLANARKAATDMGVKIKELEAGHEKVAAEIRRLGGGASLEAAAENMRREHDQIVELHDEARWLADEADYLARAHTIFPMQAAVTTLEGAVLVRHRNGITEKPSLNMTIRDGDIVETGRDGRLDLHLPDGSFLKVGPNAVYLVGNQQSRNQQSRLESGWFRFRLALRTGGESERYRYAGRGVVATVRGTDFVMQSNDDGTTLFVRHGEVEATTDKGEKITVRAGRRLFVAASGAAATQADVSEADYRRLTRP